MNIGVYLSEQTLRRFVAAHEFLGNDKLDISSRSIDEAITCLLNRYFEESGCPADLNGNPIQDVIDTVEFVYDKAEYGSVPKWRKVEVVAETDKYLEGYENGLFKRFCKSKIVGQRIIKSS